MTGDPQEIIARAPMRPMQVLAVAICVMLNALDGFDVLSISFASPGIAAEWGIDRAALGVVLSMELIGMAVGSLLLGNLADRIGRRPTILGCLAVMTAGMALAATAGDVTTLSIYRLGTGLGIGGMLAATNAAVAEFSNDRRRNLSVVLMAGGYPVGAVLGGSIASLLLQDGDWRSVFAFGAVATACFIPAVWFLLPESVSYLARRQPEGALRRVNATLRRLGHAPADSLPPRGGEAVRPGLATLFAPALARTTTLLTLAYFAHIMTFYFILKWIPKIVADMGHAPSAAGGVLVWANVGGGCGALLFGLLTQRFGLRPLLIGAMVLSAILVSVFGQAEADLGWLALIAGVAGFCTNAGVVGLYALFAHCFPTEVRAGGTGFAIGIGRAGAALGPIVAGVLFAGGAGLALVAVIMATGSLVAAVAVSWLRPGRLGWRRQA